MVHMWMPLAVKQAAVFSQKVNPAVAQMIAELFADGITEQYEKGTTTSAKILSLLTHTSHSHSFIAKRNNNNIIIIINNNKQQQQQQQ